MDKLIHCIKFEIYLYIILKPLFETVSQFESNSSPVSIVFPLIQFILLYYKRLENELMNFEPWKSFINILSNNIFYYCFTGNHSDLYATAFATSYTGKKLMINEGTIGNIMPTDKNFRLQFGSLKYIDEPFPTTVPSIDIKSIPVNAKIEHTESHKVQRAKVKSAILQIRSDLDISDPNCTCSYYV